MRIYSLYLELTNCLQNILNYQLSFSKRRILFIIILLVVFLSIYVLNLLHPLYMDDWEYSFIYRLSSLTEEKIAFEQLRISSFINIFHSQYEHYFEWGGRVVNHFILQSLLWLGGPYIEILNTLIYIVLVYLIYLFSKNNKQKFHISLLLLINIALFLFVPAFGSNILWLSGSCNYLWSTVIILLFLLPYKCYFDKPEFSHTGFFFKVPGMFLVGIFAGCTNENTAAAMIFLLGLFLVSLKIKKYKVPYWCYTGFIGAIAGFIFMIAAPGNYNRYQFTILDKDSQGVSKLAIVYEQCVTAFSGIFFYLFGIILLYFVIFIFYTYFSNFSRKDFNLSIFFFCFAKLSILAMLFAPNFPERAWFGIVVLIIIAIGILYARINFASKFLVQLKIVVLTFGIVACIGYYISGYNDLIKVRNILHARERIVLEGKKNGVEDFIFEEEINPKTNILHVFELKNDPMAYVNCSYARYYNINSVKVISKDCQ